MDRLQNKYTNYKVIKNNTNFRQIICLILSTEMDVLRKSARKSRIERIKNEHIKEIMGVKEKPDIIDIMER